MFFTLENLIYATLSIIFAPGFLLYLLVILMAAFGKSSGITKLYTKIMILIFEWGKHRIEIHNKALENNNKSSNNDQGNDDQVCDDENQDVAPAYRHPKIEFRRSIEDLHGAFTLADIMYFCRSGIKVIVDDEVTQRFDAAELPSWNLLTRTNNHYEFISWRLSILWGLGCILRLGILFPFRLILALISLTCFFVGTALIGRIQDEKSRRKYYCWLSLAIFRMMSRSFSSVITYHNRENRAKGGGICVANHTSPIDIIILGCDNCYAMVGQIQGGLFGSVQNAMSKAEHQVWFQRTEMKDRLSVTKRLKDHVEDKSLLPILIFPEGTCINNTSIMMFKKGSFEVGGTIYPVAIKYDSRFADPFWNSSKETLTRHLLNILTSWALVADVWYLPPQTQQPGETAIEFTNRVKSLIAKQGGLVDLDWDGQLKREKPKPALMKKKQEEYSRRLLNME
ncbi:hypothetical protein HELRODRAFT_186124 [Helobdella robusta]|uniref:Phospholipid/glycerol acyltransferase domain-containing protein n=1 Tax=Helobdella robusta TaxID=6412 RepID=T1FNP5_HELRO|nr:hypothetical protein HELRODRAFT_186124 [Helobdella robusta]ESN92447.1 hypothetical protein HELRODRAFT_186124 [Helobdella robusta]